MPLRTNHLAERGGVNLQRSGSTSGKASYLSGLGCNPDTASLPTNPFGGSDSSSGLKNSEIRKLLSLRVDRKRDRAELREFAAAKIADVNQKIHSLEQ